jgi:beta-ureidopropionase / N-carbamoyl-L-amino-acid hydrolase
MNLENWCLRATIYACATVGFVQVSQNSRNTIPGWVVFTVDFRHPEDAVLSQMDRELRQACEGAAAAQGYPHQDIVSGAGHDACYMARVAPTAMIFVPCVGGISHNEIEDAKPEDLTAGGNVLLNVVLDCANAAAPGEPG